jgi:hypothetical protein
MRNAITNFSFIHSPFSSLSRLGLSKSPTPFALSLVEGRVTISKTLCFDFASDTDPLRGQHERDRKIRAFGTAQSMGRLKANCQ